MGSTANPGPYSGRARRKQTRWLVWFGDAVARWTITCGGIGTIAAVSLVFVYLVSVAAPLFWPARIDAERSQSLDARATRRLALGLDEFRSLIWWIDNTGTLELVRAATAERLSRVPLLDGTAATSVSTTLGAADVAVGAVDGSVRLGTIGFAARFPSADEIPQPIRKQAESSTGAVWDQGIVQRTAQGIWRHQKLVTSLSNPVRLADEPVVRIDHVSLSAGDSIGARETLVAAVTENGRALFGKLTEQANQFTGESSLEVKSYELPEPRSTDEPPVRILIAGRGDNVFVIWRDGMLQRFDVRDPEHIVLVEQVPLLPSESARVTACELILGRETLVVGDSQGGLRAWFRLRDEQSATADQQRLTLVHQLDTAATGIRSIGASARGRTIVAGYEDGAMRMFQVTTERVMLQHVLSNAEPVLAVAIAPKEDGLLAITGKQLWTADLDPRHPEGTLSALFRPVWYEGYGKPSHMWQSSSATSAPEMKLGLMPLVYGTIKATFYAMLFATPLALLAAIYTSEFLPMRARAVVKPTIEMMASLPSVVLGFLAALVFAVIAEKWVPELLCTLFALPFACLLSAHVWQLLPQAWTTRGARWRVLFLPVPLLCGVWLGFELGPFAERWLMAGDVIRWLDGQVGNGLGAWWLLWLPLSTAGMSLLMTMAVNPWIRTVVGSLPRWQFAWLNFIKFVVETAVVLGVSLALSWLFTAIGWDPRGTFVATYVQRNAFVVGVVMGFAVIPIIYTIADDALHTVPQHLRSASLGCGATPWQTAIRVVVPTAMSGLFSAVMIGLGRAVGETMIVLMAGGNTPVMEWNVFNGFRTLAANIAVEMPEAVRDSTHYRTLFLAALTLFLMTFVVNTLAEVIRMRFRKRAFQL